jgi:hypothetical protein
MMYPVTANIYIQTDSIVDMTLSTLVVKMEDASTHTVSAAVFADIIRCVNENHG